MPRYNVRLDALDIRRRIAARLLAPQIAWASKEKSYGFLFSESVAGEKHPLWCWDSG